LVHAILRDAQSVREPGPVRGATTWDVGPTLPSGAAPVGQTLFDLDAGSETSGGAPMGIEEALAELRRQQAAIASAEQPSRLRLLAAAESAGALVAAELHDAGMPWDVGEHDRIL